MTTQHVDYGFGRLPVSDAKAQDIRQAADALDRLVTRQEEPTADQREAECRSMLTYLGSNYPDFSMKTGSVCIFAGEWSVVLELSAEGALDLRVWAYAGEDQEVPSGRIQLPALPPRDPEPPADADDPPELDDHCGRRDDREDPDQNTVIAAGHGQGY